jgi:hypothetical protein
MLRPPSKKAIGLWVVLVALLAAAGIWLVCGTSRATPPLASVLMADGRVLQIEALTYGMEHSVGTRSILVENFGAWLPARIRHALTPKSPHFKIRTAKPALVVWVNALKADTGAQVDCQGIRVEFVDEHEDLFGEATSYWSGGPNFWRVGHAFHAYPSAQSLLTLRITPLSTMQTLQVQVPNPRVMRPARWVGRPLPQRTNIGELELILTSVALCTNGGPKKPWETPSRYWQPMWELRHHGLAVTDWEQPVEWSAEDLIGNQSRFLGVHQPVLRFTAVFVPAASNLDTQVVQLLTNTPPMRLANISSNNWLNVRTRWGSQELLLMGVVSAGTYTFNEGLPASDPSVRAGPVSGGAPSGWVGQTKRVNPAQVRRWDSHYTPGPVIYVRAGPLENGDRLAVRLKDAHGRYWLTKPEPQGIFQDIRPFLIGELPSETTTVTAELVVLKPVKASFDVDMSRVNSP